MKDKDLKDEKASDVNNDKDSTFNTDGIFEVNSDNRGKKKIIIAALALVLISVAGYIFYSKKAPNKNDQIEQEKKAIPAQPVIDKAIFYHLDEIIINLDSADKDNSFLKVKISLELDNQKSLAVVQEMMPKIHDIFLLYLRSLRSEDLKGSAGLYRLREELMLRINKAIAPATITDVLFRDLLIQ